MSWEDTTPAQGTPEGEVASPAADVTTTPSTAPADASSAQPAGEPEVPFHQHPRWIEVQEARRQAEQQLSQYSPWQPVIEQLTAQGLNPQQIAQYLAQPPPADPQEQPDPEVEFESYLRGKGLDIYDLDPAMADVQRELFRFQQQRDQFQREQEQASQQQRYGQFRTEYAQVASQPGNEVFRDPVMADVTGLIFEKFGAGAADIVSLLQKPINAYVQGELAKIQQGKQQDGEFPVTAGGNGVAPVERRSIHDMTRTEKAAAMAEHRRALEAAGQL